MDTRIYCITHKTFTKPDDDLYIPLHVGHAISEDLGYTGDDTGENISEKNKTYCELTGMYWLWKNIQCDIIGICHYRRYFVRNEAFLTKDYIEDILCNQGYDVIVSHSGETKYNDVREHYSSLHYVKDFDYCGEILKKMYPEYGDAFDFAAKHNFMTLGNMIIAKKEVYNRYCEWLFPLLFEIEKNIDISEYDQFQARIFGYLAERLFRVWLLGSTFKIKEEEVLLIDPANAENADKIIAIRKQCVNLILKDFLLLCDKAFREPMWSDMCDSIDAQQGKLPVDFHGKIPVFACWWQGLDSAPDMVKRCLDSIDRNLPAELVEFHLITLENVGNYITFPDWVVDKFNNESISYTELSDILRTGLLNKYGGMWIDATYYMTDKFNPDILLNNQELVSLFNDDVFWTIKYKKSIWKTDISMGRWSCNIMYVNKGNPIMRFVVNAFYEYWRTQDSLIDYFLLDYLINMAYERIPEAKKLIDGVKCSNSHALDIRDIANKRFHQDKWDELISDTSIFKLQRREEVIPTNIVGDMTYYGKLIEY